MMMLSNAQTPLGRMGVRGYVTNQEFGGLRIPVTVQSMVLRDYAAKNKLSFELPVGEYFFPNCYVQLDGLLRQLDELTGIMMCSLFMLPKSEVRRREIYDLIIRHGCALHMVFESLVILSAVDADRAEEIIRFQDTLRACPQKIPAELLPPIEAIDHFA